MVTISIYIEFLEREHGLSIASLPEAKNPTPYEMYAMGSLSLAFQESGKRFTEQMVNNTLTSMSARVTEGTSAADYVAGLRAKGLLRHLTATVMLMDGLYTVTAEARTGHPFEAAAWKTMKRALDLASDFMCEERFGYDAEEDERQLTELLEEELAKEPVLPKLEK